MFYAISSCCCPRQSDKNVYALRKIALSADLFISIIAILGLTYAALNISGVNLGPLNSASTYMGNNEIKYLFAVSGGLLAFQCLVALLNICKNENEFQKVSRIFWQFS